MKKIMKHNMITGETRIAGRYRKRSYWLSRLVVTGIMDGEQYEATSDMVPDKQLRATQMIDMVLGEYQQLIADFERVDTAEHVLWRLTPRDYETVDADVLTAQV